MHNQNAATSTHLNLLILGVVTLAIGVVTAIEGLLHGLHFFTSVSASATHPQTSMLLPFALGAMALFFTGYQGYDVLDKVCAKVMAAGAFLVALQPSTSPANETSRSLGVFVLPPKASAIVHAVAALILFIVMVFWCWHCFSKTGPGTPTKKKLQRNLVYRVCGIIGVVSLAPLPAQDVVAFLSDFFGWEAAGLEGFRRFPFIWLAELQLFVACGVAVLVKAGAFLRDNDA